MYRANIYTKPINNSKISTLFWYLCNHIFHDNQLLFFLVGVDVWFPRRWNIWQILDGLRSFNVQCSKAVKVDTYYVGCILHHFCLLWQSGFWWLDNLSSYLLKKREKSPAMLYCCRNVCASITFWPMRAQFVTRNSIVLCQPIRGYYLISWHYGKV